MHLRKLLLPAAATIAAFAVLLPSWFAAAAAPYPAPAVTPQMKAGVKNAPGAEAIHALVERQVQAWEKHDFSIAADDWLPDGELTSPGGHAKVKDMQAVITDYFKSFRDLQVVVKSVFLSADGTKAAIEWDWDVTRRRDGVGGVTHDGIIVDLVGGKIKSWREYFDFSGSVDANP